MEKKVTVKTPTREMTKRAIPGVKEAELKKADSSNPGTMVIVSMRKKDRGLTGQEDPNKVKTDSSKAGMKITVVAHREVTIIATEKEDTLTEATRHGII